MDVCILIQNGKKRLSNIGFFIFLSVKETRIGVVNNTRVYAHVNNAYTRMHERKEKKLKKLLTLLARYSIFLEVDAYICRHIDV